MSRLLALCALLTGCDLGDCDQALPACMVCDGDPVVTLDPPGRIVAGDAGVTLTGTASGPSGAAVLGVRVAGVAATAGPSGFDTWTATIGPERLAALVADASTGDTAETSAVIDVPLQIRTMCDRAEWVDACPEADSADGGCPTAEIALAPEP